MSDWHELGSTRKQPEEPPKEPEPKQSEQPAEQETAVQSKTGSSKKKILLSCIAASVVVATAIFIAVVALNWKHTEAPNDTLLEATTIQTESEITTEVKETDSTETATYGHETIEAAIYALMGDQQVGIHYSEESNTYHLIMYGQTSTELYPVFEDARKDLEKSLDDLCVAIADLSGSHVSISYLSSTFDTLYVTYDGDDVTAFLNGIE